jgi:ABC-type uncharacterized transport system permease subunit
MGNTQSKPLAAWQGKGMGAAWERHGMCKLTFNFFGSQRIYELVNISKPF